MQTTLLGIAIAVILAVVVAIVGPLLIDWTAYRPIIEAQATHVLGAEVHVGGAIDGRLLPSPRLTLHDVSIGSGAQKIRADELDLQFALTPLLRGTWQAEQMRLAGPQVALRVDKNGRVQAPALDHGALDAEPMIAVPPDEVVIAVDIAQLRILRIRTHVIDGRQIE